MTAFRTIACLVAAGLPPAGRAQTPAAPIDVVGPDQPRAALRFHVRDAAGVPIPMRLTLDPVGDTPPAVFANVNAAPDDYAVRKNVVYARRGRGAITVPVGTYDVYASRGLEWSLAKQRFTFASGRTYELDATLRQEIDSAGWVSGDFHLHTLTYSGHGDANMKERVITLIGEGLEFAVATDHNHNSDYQPTLRQLGIADQVSAVTGNEVTTSIGHFNAFPLDPARPVPPYDLTDANRLFRLIRAETNPFGVTPVIQLNHPRWGGLDYFGPTGLDPYTGVSDHPGYSGDFDCLEVFNGNEAWGYFDADVPQEVRLSSMLHWTLGDWFNLLNRGHRYAAVGNSDSHTVHSEFAAYPRNFIAVEHDDDPGDIRVSEVVAAVRAKRLFTTCGPFVTFTANGVPMGGETAVRDGGVDLHIAVQAASWIDCDRVRIVVNGDVVRDLPVGRPDPVRRLDAGLRLAFERDAWVALLVEGDQPLHPIVPDAGRQILPLAVTNPVWIDADGDGAWTSPWEQARRAVAGLPAAAPEELAVAHAGSGPHERGLLLIAAAQAGHPAATALAQAGLNDGSPIVRRRALRAAEELGAAFPQEALRAALRFREQDPYFWISTLGALADAGDGEVGAQVVNLLRHDRSGLFRRFGRDLEPLLPGEFVRAWRVVGYFDNPSPQAVLTTAYGPESSADPAAVFTGKGGSEVRWQERAAGSNGFLDLSGLAEDRGLAADAIAYAETWLHAPDERNVTCALGTDDGARAWLSGEVIHEDATRHSARPLQTVTDLSLRAGWNRLLVKVENGGGGSGLYFRVLDDEVRAAARPD